MKEMSKNVKEKTSINSEKNSITDTEGHTYKIQYLTEGAIGKQASWAR